MNTSQHGASGLDIPKIAVAAETAVAVAGALAAAAAGFGSRLGLWHFRTGFAILEWSAIAAAAAAVAAAVTVVILMRTGHRRQAALCLVPLMIGGAIAAEGISWKLRAASVPPIHDITTDIVKPPQFVKLLPEREKSPNGARYGGPEVAVQQRRAYPDITSLIVPLPAADALTRAADTARALGWSVAAVDPASGTLEATDTTFWFGFRDDIVVRVTPVDDHRSIVDIRSASRVGRSDVGTNAARIRKFLGRMKGPR